MAFVTLVIGNSVARAFGLVSALSIVRFRSVVDDTRDTAFVIFTVVVAVVAGLTAWRDGRPADEVTGRLVVRLGLGHEPAVPAGVLGKHFTRARPTGAATVAELNRLDGVQAVEVRADGPPLPRRTLFPRRAAGRPGMMGGAPTPPEAGCRPA